MKYHITGTKKNNAASTLLCLIVGGRVGCRVKCTRGELTFLEMGFFPQNLQFNPPPPITITQKRVFTPLWPEYWDQPKTSHQRLLDHILLNYSITHPSICEFIRIFVSVAPSTGSLKKSFSKLSRLGHKDRNQMTTTA